MNLAFRSKVDRKLAILTVAVPSAAVVAVLTSGGARALPWPGALVMVLVLGLVSWVLVATYYVFDHDRLVVRSGPFRWRIPLKEITAVCSSQSTRSAPALSLDRLEIAFGPGQSMLVSPADRSGFIATLRRRAPHAAISVEPR